MWAEANYLIIQSLMDLNIMNNKYTNKHRQNIVRSMILGISHQYVLSKNITNHDTAFIPKNNPSYKDGDVCMITHLYFPRKMSEMLTTYSNYGPIFMGLWLDTPLILNDDGGGNTLFPMWLAEVLKELGHDIHENDIYEDDNE